MKHLSIFYVIILSLFFGSCSKDDIVTNAEYGTFSFTIKERGITSGTSLKSGSSMADVAHAIISIHKGGKTFQDYDLKKIKVSDWGSGTLVSDEIKLWVGNDYELVRFELQNKDNKTLYAAPLKGSGLADKVSKPLAISFTIEKDKTSPVEVEVLSTEEATPADFGFVQFNVKVVDGATGDMILVEGGSFSLVVANGDLVKNASGEWGHADVTYKINVSDFHIGKYEVTQQQWLDIMGTKHRGFIGGDLPACNVGKTEVLEFIDKLNKKTGEKYRLPTEAEWLFAARGGTKSKGYKFSGSNDLNAVAWTKTNSDDKVHPVGKKQANELGIYDMNGNVNEWCLDAYKTTNELSYAMHEKGKTNIELTNPKVEGGEYVVGKGGSISFSSENEFRIAQDRLIFWKAHTREMWHISSSSFSNFGFRLVKEK